MGLESPLKAEGPVGGKLLFELDRWMGGRHNYCCWCNMVLCNLCTICICVHLVQAVSVRHANVLVKLCNFQNGISVFQTDRGINAVIVALQVGLQRRANVSMPLQ